MPSGSMDLCMDTWIHGYTKKIMYKSAFKIVCNEQIGLYFVESKVFQQYDFVIRCYLTYI